MDTICALHWLAHAGTGLRLAALEPWTDEPIPYASLWPTLEAEAKGWALQTLGAALPTQPRCTLCQTDAPATFMSLRSFVRRNLEGRYVIVEAYAQDPARRPRFFCLNCQKTTQAANRTPLSNHATLAHHAATWRRAPLVFGTFFLPKGSPT